ncbi:MAG: aldo/keto reductase [Anaerolineae bacterium]|nr:aldo/keto reductase [Anaerolineae bacterium]
MSKNIPEAQVGTTALKVTEFGLGTAHIGYQTVENAVNVVHTALDNGVKFLDTAPLYKTEKYLGVALEGIPRESYVVATKIGRLPDGKGGFTFNYSRDEVLQSLENSLKTLKLDYVDILHIHDADNHFQIALDEAFPTLAELRSQGVIKAVGAGMNQWQMLADFARNADFDCFLMAGRYTLIEQTSLEALKLFQEKQMSIFAGGVFNSGILATGATQNAKYQYGTAPEDIKEKVKKIEAIATRYGVPLNAAAIQFVRAHPAVTSLVLGAETPEQVLENVEAWGVEIPAAFWQDIRAQGLIEESAPTP